MKRIRISRCGSQLLSQPTTIPRRPICPYAAAALQRKTTTSHNHRIQVRLQSTSAASDAFDLEEASSGSGSQPSKSSRLETKHTPLEGLPSPHPSAAERSSKLAALRSRLSLPERFPLQTLARTLVHPSADPNPAFNNASLAVMGANLLGYYTTEHIICNYPRLPIEVLFAAQEAYIGPKALATIAAEWGIEAVAEPGGEVDPGLLQLKRLRPGENPNPGSLQPFKPVKWNITTTHRIMKGDEFGVKKAFGSAPLSVNQPVTLETAAQSFVRALVGSLHLHLGRPLAKRFFRDHFMSRHLDISKLFDFRTPTWDLSKLCAREGFEPPIARLISETGRLSRHPVFVVGVYSGNDKLGEGVGSSLDEARVRAAAAALKGWYLYKPLDVTVPSSTEGIELEKSNWRPNLVDCGEVIC
ncbi:60S ribosomal protein L3 [Pleomassaria siparia CBS 279.74]|uniref:Large ribosomal subunit protein mL44 n=1 Tax=Pleomassaria siparia CBS 279.74 TaxID=1314801 RepID=A0A6G1KK78_9PLEO|nr:60S ribosomal protein L3 [Pleomassaria siparia CBS 279.74]